MSQIIIKYNSQCFWINDHFIELLSQYICETFEDIGLSTFNSALSRIYFDCDFNRSGEAIQMVSIRLDNIITQNDKNTLINIFLQTKTRILALGTELSISQLNAFENNKTDDLYKLPWDFPVKTQSLATTLDYIIDLLNGTFQYNNYGIQYINFPNNSGDYLMI
ncbi:MAG: hypothetical protein JXR34_05115 [Bacteroidales bacterium]|nr:hypothetical protein [Bacteroidales bacterium]